jgi:hypothetical protein
MRYQQRPEVDTSSLDPTSRLWNPQVRREDGDLFPAAPEPEDSYVVVDEIVEDSVRLVASMWPVLDSGGRLHFSEDSIRSERPITGSDLKSALDLHRERAGQTLRPIRISDSFLVRGNPFDHSEWTYVLDVTEAARHAARAAFLSAVVPPDPDTPLIPEDMLQSTPEAPPEEPDTPSPGSVVNPAV